MGDPLSLVVGRGYDEATLNEMERSPHLVKIGVHVSVETLSFQVGRKLWEH
jgi:hypothetical protein